ncbi:hypothetical protein HZA55_06090 [Candidatus Poribacteria bacterium]|nr:hypothetical protein [Candidatus Poribacteria bacterium]
MYVEKLKKVVFVLLLCFSSLILIGCDEQFQVYIKEDVPLHKVKKIVVFPFRNISKDKNADDILRNAINIELMKSGLMEIINLNEAEKALKEARIRTAGGVDDLSVSQAKKLGESLGIQGAVLGVIEDFGPGGKTGAPQFSGYLYMVDTNDGSILWSCSYTGSGDSKNYIFDINKIETPTLHARKVMQKMFSPLIAKAKSSEKEAETKIAKVEDEAKKLEEIAAHSESEAKSADSKARDQEDEASRKEKEAAEYQDKALKMDPEGIAKAISAQEEALKTKGDDLTKAEEESKKLESIMTELTSKVKELEEAEKAAKATAEEIAGQVNIYTAKQRVAVIRNNTEEAEKFKALAEEAKGKNEEATNKAETLKKEVAEAKAKVDDMTPRINSVRKNVNDLKAESDKISAKLAEVKQIKETQNIEPTEENIALAKKAKEDAEVLRQTAVTLREQAKTLRKDADAKKEKAKKDREAAVEARKRATEVKSKLSS